MALYKLARYSILGVRPSVTFLVNVSPSKPLEVATSNFVVGIGHNDVEGTGQHFV